MIISSNFNYHKKWVLLWQKNGMMLVQKKIASLVWAGAVKKSEQSDIDVGLRREKNKLHRLL